MGQILRAENQKKGEEYVENELEKLEIELSSDEDDCEHGEESVGADEDVEQGRKNPADSVEQNKSTESVSDINLEHNKETHVNNYSLSQERRDSDECLYTKSMILPSEEEMAPAFIRAEEQLVSKYHHHVKQFTEMREFIRECSKKAKQHHDDNVTWQERTILEFADYAQNMDMPHFGSEQPGDIYYYSPLGIYVFGLVDTSGGKSKLTAFYYKEGVGKKGGNNVASLLWKNAKLKLHLERSKKDGALKEYILTMDNCGGQNKNRMVIRFLLMMAELKVYKKVLLLFLVRGHTKNPCDRMYMLLKQRFHFKNVYTMSQLHDNLNSNDDVNAIESTVEDFYDLDTVLAKYYSVPQSGTVNRSHMFIMDSKHPGKLILKDSTSEEERVQNLKCGDLTNDERIIAINNDLKQMKPITPPGLKQIKRVELGTKWRKLVPEQYADDICPRPSKELLASHKKSERERKKQNAGNVKEKEIIDPNLLVEDKEVLKKLRVKDLKIQLGLRNLRKNGKKEDLIKRLIDAVANSDRATNDTEASAAEENIILSQPCNV